MKVKNWLYQEEFIQKIEEIQRKLFKTAGIPLEEKIFSRVVEKIKKEDD